MAQQVYHSESYSIGMKALAKWQGLSNRQRLAAAREQATALFKRNVVVDPEPRAAAGSDDDGLDGTALEHIVRVNTFFAKDKRPASVAIPHLNTEKPICQPSNDPIQVQIDGGAARFGKVNAYRRARSYLDEEDVRKAVLLISARLLLRSAQLTREYDEFSRMPVGERGRAQSQVTPQHEFLVLAKWFYGWAQLEEQLDNYRDRLMEERYLRVADYAARRMS